MQPNEAREAIVRRRAQFVASALAAAGVVSTGSAALAQDQPDAAPDATTTDAGEMEPEVCLCACEAVGITHAPGGLLPLAAAGLVALARRRPRRSAASPMKKTREAP